MATESLINIVIQTEQRKLTYYTYRYIPSADDIADIVQDSLLALWQNREQFVDGVHARRWLWKVAHNKIHDFLRKKYQLNLASFDYEKMGNEEVLELGAYVDNFSKWQRVIDELLQKLPAEDQQLYQLRYRDSMTMKDIAPKLNTNTNNIKIKLHRLTNKLIKLWQKN